MSLFLTIQVDFEDIESLKRLHGNRRVNPLSDRIIIPWMSGFEVSGA